MTAVPQHLARQQLLTRITKAMPSVDRDAVKGVAVDLAAKLHRDPDASPNTVLVAYGGGKDSSYMVAFVRSVQLYTLVELGVDIKLRVATNRHAGMPPAVMLNIDRTYRALGMHDDERVELLLIDGSGVSAFSGDAPIPDDLVRRNRTDILMNGHRFAGEARPTFCNACNLSMVNAFGVAAGWGDGADIIITGDSRDEQKAYLLWTRRLARDFGAAPNREQGGLDGFLRTIDGIADRYNAEIHGSSSPERSGVRHGLPKRAEFFSIYGYTDYAAGAHWDFLTGFLGFEFDELAFSFTESDCANPLLMAHFRGLRAERLQGRSYTDGISEYRDFALGLMRRKDFPEELLAIMAKRYESARAVAYMRQLAADYALGAFGLTETQIVCMLAAPFGDQGARLRRWLVAEAPSLVASEQAIHDLLGSNDGTDPVLESALLVSTGLTLPQLRQCWRNCVIPNLIDPRSISTPIGRVLRDDPHKAMITTRHSDVGGDVTEVISGR